MARVCEYGRHWNAPWSSESAALDAVMGLKFQPAMRNGVPVGSVKTIEVPFYPDCKRIGRCNE